MRSWSSYNWITDRIALGSAVSKRGQVEVLVGEGITHVLDCQTGRPLEEIYHGAGIVYRQNGTRDDGMQKPDEWFFAGIDFALTALRLPRSKVFVHCMFGMARSPSLVYAILRWHGEGA